MLNLFKYILILNYEDFPFALIKPIEVNRFSLTYDYDEILQLEHTLNVDKYYIIKPIYNSLRRLGANLKLKYNNDTYIVVQPEGIRYLLLQPEWIDNKDKDNHE